MQKFSVYYPEVCLQLNMFRAFSCSSSGAQWLQWQPLVLPSYRGDSYAVFVEGPAGPTTSTAVIELLMMCGKTPETCWAVNKRQDNKLENCCIRLVIYLNYEKNFKNYINSRHLVCFMQFCMYSLHNVTSKDFANTLRSNFLTFHELSLVITIKIW